MTKRIVVIVCALSWVLASAILALAQHSGPKPGPEHQKLAPFAGTWTFEGEMKQSAMSQGGKISAIDTCEWFQGGFAIVCHSDKQGPMGPAKSLSILAYDRAKQLYTYLGINSFGTPVYSTGTVEGDTWTYTSVSDMGGKPMKTRVIIELTTPTSYTYTLGVSSDGSPWMTMLVGTGTKTGP